MTATHLTPGAKHRFPESLRHLDLNLVGRALVEAKGNVTQAAKNLGVPPHELRRLTWSVPALIDVALEPAEQMVDAAEQSLHEALDSDDPRRRDSAAMFILSKHRLARERGWGQTGKSNLPPSDFVVYGSDVSNVRAPEDARIVEVERRQIAAEAEGERRQRGEYDPR
jgi:hypothetical protein